MRTEQVTAGLRLVKREGMEIHELKTLGELKLVALKKRMATGGSHKGVNPLVTLEQIGPAYAIEAH